MSSSIFRRALSETQLHNMDRANDASAAMIKLLNSLLSTDATERSSGESSVAEAAKQTGFGAALVQTIMQQHFPEGTRQLAAVLLKRHVKEHWAEESKHFKQPVVSDSEKSSIRNQLPQGLADTLPKIRIAVSMAIAGIAKWDLPDAWPGLLNLLMQALTTKANQDLGKHFVRACISQLTLAMSDLIIDDHDFACSGWRRALLSPPCRRAWGRASHAGLPFVSPNHACYSYHSRRYWHAAQHVCMHAKLLAYTPFNSLSRIWFHVLQFCGENHLPQTLT